MIPALAVQSPGVGVVTADNMNTWVQNGAFISNLRGFIGLNNMMVAVEGTAAANDGGQGFFYYNTSSTATDDNINVIRPNGVSTGAWLRLQFSGANITLSNATVNVVPATGVNAPFLSRLRSMTPLITDIDPLAGSSTLGSLYNDSNAFAAAVADCAGVILPTPQGGYRYNGNMTINKSSFALSSMQNSRLLVPWQNNNASAPITIDASGTGGLNDIQISGFHIVNQNSGTYTTTNGIVLADTSGSGTSDNFLELSNLYVEQFQYDLIVNDTNAEWVNIRDCRFENALTANIYFNMVAAGRFPSVWTWTNVRSAGSQGPGRLYNLNQTNPIASHILYNCNDENNVGNAERFIGTTGFQNYARFGGYMENNSTGISHGASAPYKANVGIECTYGIAYSNYGVLHYGVTAGTNPDYGIYNGAGTTSLVVSGCRFNSFVTNDVYSPTNGYDGGGNTFSVGGNFSNVIPATSSGNFTPALNIGGATTGITYSNQLGTYRRIGAEVQYEIYLSLTSKGSLTGALTITGLPFTAANISNEFVVGSVIVDQWVTQSPTTSNAIGAYITPNTTTLTLIYNFDSAGTWTQGNPTNAWIGNSSTMKITGTYQI